MAWAAGLDLPILNPFDQRMMDVTRATAVLLNRDSNSSAYIEYYRDFATEGLSGPVGLRHSICGSCNIPDQLSKVASGTITEKESKDDKTIKVESGSIKERIIRTVLDGEKDQIIALLDEALKINQWPAMELVNQALIPGIEAAGVLYEQKKYFLPQLLMAAETMKTAFNYLKPLLATENRQDAGTIVMATVEGDIHDIGKNIVTLMLENYGFRIIDLGKDGAAQPVNASAIAYFTPNCKWLSQNGDNSVQFNFTNNQNLFSGNMAGQLVFRAWPGGKEIDPVDFNLQPYQPIPVPFKDLTIPEGARNQRMISEISVEIMNGNLRMGYLTLPIYFSSVRIEKNE
jgi:hypothetical protein